MALADAASHGPSVGTTTPLAPPAMFTFTLTDFGAIFFRCFSILLQMSLGSWLGTSRIVILQEAIDGRTVLCPSP